MSYTVARGLDGRVKVGGTAVAGIKSWSLNKQVAEIPAPHFELGADADGVIWNLFYIGLGDATVDIEGMYDVGNNTETVGFTVGTAVTLDLLFTKTSPFGFSSLAGFVRSLSPSTNVENQMANFKATIRLSGAIPKGAAISPPPPP